MRNRKWWLTFHRIVGLYSLLFLFLIAVSGLILSFSETLQLEDRAAFFSQHSLSLEHHSLALQGDKLLLNDINTGARCVSPMAGAYNMTQPAPSVMVACQNVLYWITWDGDILDSINVPAELRPVTSAYFLESQFLIKTAAALTHWNTEQAALHLQSQPLSLPTPLPSIDGEGTNMAQWLLNVHTGLMAGDLGRWLMRLAGLGLLLLCISGFKNALKL